MPQAIINTEKRSLKVEETLSATVITGTDKIRSGFGNGDCLLCDFTNSIFTVADASERCSMASREILGNLANTLSSTEKSCTDSMLQTYIENIYQEQRYNHKSTFSCISLNKNDDETTLSVLNGGDSMVMVVDSTDGSIIFRTHADMNFAGRSKQKLDVETLTLKNPHCRIIIATDGFYDVINFFNRDNSVPTNSDKIPRQLITVPVHETIDQIHKIIESKQGETEYDDIGVIIIDPFHINRYKGKNILLGGTTPKEESDFINHIWPKDYEKWIPEAAWEDHTKLLQIANIEVIDSDMTNYKKESSDG